MSILSEKYLAYLATTTEASRSYDENFLDLQHEYSKELEQERFDEIRRNFVSDGEWYQDEFFQEGDHRCNDEF